MRLIIALLVTVTALRAQITDSLLKAHPELTASSYALYPEPDSKNNKLTKATKGYMPFYISHYGRHGSRYHYTGDDYKYLYETLAKADSANALTPMGKKALIATGILNEKATPRIGDLTQVGARQHQGIASRMFRNYPEIFKTKKVKGNKVVPHIDTYASTSGRCIVSMAAFTGELRALNPEATFRYESGKNLMKFICPFDWNKIEYSKTQAYVTENDKLWAAVNPQPLMHKLFSDSAYVTANIDVNNFYNKLFETNTSLPGMDSTLMDIITGALCKPEDKNCASIMDSLFTVEESIARWKAQNAWWYSVLGTSPLINSTEGTDFGKNTLANIISEADMAIAIDTSDAVTSGKAQPVSATLRFGHDTGLLPLAGLMQLSIADAKVSDLSKLHEEWNDFRVIPMAANLQIVFYKSSAAPSKKASKSAAKVDAESSPILVKFLYNEREVTAPIPCEENCPAAPYYKWDDVKKFYNEML